jgi:hypothetical protein
VTDFPHDTRELLTLVEAAIVNGCFDRSAISVTSQDRDEERHAENNAIEHFFAQFNPDPGDKAPKFSDPLAMPSIGDGLASSSWMAISQVIDGRVPGN